MAAVWALELRFGGDAVQVGAVAGDYGGGRGSRLFVGSGGYFELG
jgi:hypothetical protein